LVLFRDLLGLLPTSPLRQPKEIFIDMDKLSLHGLTQYYIKLDEGQKTRKLTDLMDILGGFPLLFRLIMFLFILEN
jgi:hypothetical protein